MQGEHLPGTTAFKATIGVGVGDDDTVDTITEAEFPTALEARSWIELTLPDTEFPEWVKRRPFGPAGAFLFGSFQHGSYGAAPDGAVVWMPERGAESFDVVLVEGRLRWRVATDERPVAELDPSGAPHVPGDGERRDVTTLGDTAVVGRGAVVLRARMVGRMRAHGDLRSAEVVRAFAAVARERFAPDVPLEQVYDRDDVVVTKRDEDGLALSSVSAPRIQARMLEQADVRPGMRVLEIGSGGYQAALLAELVGPGGRVVTIDIDPFVVERARRYLTATGYPQVRVMQGDGEVGVPELAPFDRIVVTAGAWDIPPAWIEQLTPDGVLVVPLRLRGLMRSFALAREAGHLVSQSHELCGFVPMRGAGANAEQVVLLRGEDIALRVDGDQVVDGEGLRTALASPRVVLGSGVEVGGFEPFDDLDLFLATALDGFGLLLGTDAAIEAGVVERSATMGAKTAFAGPSFAYRASRATSTERTSFEFVVCGHGPDAADIAAEYVELIREWDRVHRNGSGAWIEVFPAGTPDTEIPEGRLVEKKHSRVLISYPSRPI